MKIMLIWNEFDLKIFTSLNNVMEKNMIVSVQSLTMLYVFPCSYLSQSQSPAPQLMGLVLTIVGELKH
jgi:hypothetical protein